MIEKRLSGSERDQKRSSSKSCLSRKILDDISIYRAPIQCQITGLGTKTCVIYLISSYSKLRAFKGLWPSYEHIGKKYE